MTPVRAVLQIAGNVISSNRPKEPHAQYWALAVQDHSTRRSEW